MLNHPKVAGPWFAYNNVLLYDPAITARQRELAILRVAWLARGTYEWLQHVRLGQQAGITDAELEAIAAGPDAGSWAPLEADLLRAVDELMGDARISDDTWKRLSEHFDTRQLMLESRVVDRFPLNDQEILCRHLHKVTADWIADYERTQMEPAR